MNHRLDIRGSLTEQQYKQMRMEMQKNKFFGWFVGFFFVAMGGWTLAINETSLGMVLLMALFTAAGGTGLIYQHTRTRVRIEYHTAEHLQKPQRWIIEETGIEQQLINDHFFLHWKDLYGFREETTYFQLYTSKQHYVLVPKYFFFPNDLRVFRHCLHAASEEAS